MKKQGTVNFGVQEATVSGQNETQIKAGGTAVASAAYGTSGGYLAGSHMICNPQTVTTTTEIPGGYNAVMAGPISITGTLTVNGTLTIV